MTFKDLPLNLRVEILKGLPKGAILRYHNPRSKIHGKNVIKINDFGWTMLVLDMVMIPIHYKNLTCDEIEKAVAVTNRINQ